MYDVIEYRNSLVLIITMISLVSQVSSLCLLELNWLEQSFEITSTETLMVVSLNNFDKESRPVFTWFSEKLEKITMFIKID